ncbi:hypothetical protein D3C73_869980 [compost metagenome]
MCDKTKIGFVRSEVNSDVVTAIFHRLAETHPGQFEIVEMEEQEPMGMHPFDHIFLRPEALERTVNILTRQPFRLKYRDRIDRYNRVWPRLGCPMLTWNRDRKWLPRFFDTPRKYYFSQPQLRQSQVMSLRSTSNCHRHTVCSLADLDLSRWP